MSDQQVIREFLVGLGFKIDEGGVRKFAGALTGTTNIALTAGKAVVGVGLAAEAMVVAFSAQMEKLYYASRRTKASVENLQAIEYGSKRVGLEAGVAREALEGMAAAVRMNPGLRGLMDGILGKSTAGMDQADAMLELVQKLSSLPHMVGARFAQMFGMDEKTFLMLKEGMPELLRSMQERKSLNESLGVDAEKAAEAAKEYQNSIREILEKVGAIGQKWSVEVMPYFREFNRLINDALDRLAKFDMGEGLKSIIKFVDTVGPKKAAEELAKGNYSAVPGAMVKHAPGTVLLRKAWEWLTGSSGEPGKRESSGKITSAPTSAAPVGAAPLGLRQNNPGNLRSWGSAPVQNGFARFNSTAEGLSAMAGNLVAYYNKYGAQTVRDIVSRWAPSSENDTQGYIAAIAKKLGVDAGQALNMKDPATLSRLMGAMIQQEQGYNPFGTAELMAAAQGRLGGGAGQAKQVVIHQKTDIHVAGVSDPAAAGNAVANSQSRVNGDLVRNMAGVIQ